MKPTFIGIGAQKCASTWLHRILAEHPQVGVPEEKEIDFFSYRFDHGYQWYERKFEHCRSRAAAGEISPSYFTEPGVPQRVHQYLPAARIVVSLRDPVIRALSNHRHEIRVGHFTGADLSFDAGLANNPMYIDQGRYATHIKRWLDYFPSTQILIVFMEDIREHPLEVASRVFEFLGVDSSYRPQGLEEQYNKSFANRYPALAKIKDEIYRYAGKPGLRWAWGLGATLGLRALYRRVNVIPSERVIPPPNEKTIAELRARFEPEIRELSQLVGRRLDHWIQT